MGSITDSYDGKKKIGCNGGVSRVYHSKPYDRGIKSIYKQS